MESDTSTLRQFHAQRFLSALRTDSISEEDFSESTDPDQVPHVLVRMLASLAMLLLSAVIVVGIHIYARTSEPGKDVLLSGGSPANNLRKPDPRILDLTLGPPLTEAPAPHQIKETSSSAEAHPTTELRTETRPSTIESSEGRMTSTSRPSSLLKTTTDGTTQARWAQPLTVPGMPSGSNETTSEAKQDTQSPLDSTTSVTATSTTNYKDGTICPDVHKSFCNTSGPAQFFYDPNEGSCLAATAQKAHVCNRSPNQFASMDDCTAACVKGRRAPQNRCLHKPRFVACSAVDARGAWWFHDGLKCVPWSFASGRCPLASAPAFDTRMACGAQCNDSRSRKERGCQLPVSQLCEPSQLRLPFFAVPSATDKGAAFECHKVDWEFLLRHRCLLGFNAFVSREECHETCRGRSRKY